MTNVDRKVMVIDLGRPQTVGMKRVPNPLSLIPKDKQTGLEVVVRRIGEEVYARRTGVVDPPLAGRGQFSVGDTLPTFVQSPYKCARILGTAFLNEVHGAIVVSTTSTRDKVNKVLSYVEPNWEKWQIPSQWLVRVAHVTLADDTCGKVWDCIQAESLLLAEGTEDVKDLCKALGPIFS